MIKFKIISSNDTKNKSSNQYERWTKQVKKEFIIDIDIDKLKNTLKYLVNIYNEKSELTTDEYKLINSIIANLRNDCRKVNNKEILESLIIQVGESDAFIKRFKFNENKDCYVKESVWSLLKSSIS